MKIVIANSNPIHTRLCESLKEKLGGVYVITQKSDLTVDILESIKPTYVFFPHWSFIIPKKIYDNFQCVVFHMTDLPFGRGGSPLQNLIECGFETTKISAIKVGKGIDTGDVYLKKDVSLHGTAEEIFIRIGYVIESMIDYILVKKPIPKPQEGDIVEFQRRKPEQSNIEALSSIEKIYDYIRMLDAESYPKAYIETEHFRFEFSRASQKKDCLIADVRIIKK